MKKLKKLNKSEIENCKFLSLFYSRVREFFYDRKNSTNKLHYFNAIPIGSEIIYDLMLIKKNFPNNSNLIDVGCGKGNVLKLAESMSFYSKGIEYRKEYKKFLNDCNYYIGDAFNYKSYNIHNVIYLFMPIASPIKMSQLLNYIDTQIKKDTIILFYGNCNKPTSWKQLKSNLFIKT